MEDKIFPFCSGNRTSRRYSNNHVTLPTLESLTWNWIAWEQYCGMANDFSSHKSKLQKEDYFRKKTSHSCINYIKRKNEWKFQNGSELSTSRRDQKRKKTDGLIFNLQNYLLMLPYWRNIKICYIEAIQMFA